MDGKSEGGSASRRWCVCPRGTFETLATRLRRRGRRGFLEAAAAGLSAVALGAAALVWLVPRSRSSPLARLNCEQTLARAEAHARGDLSSPEAELVRAHLRNCPGCAAAYARLGVPIEGP